MNRKKTSTMAVEMCDKCDDIHLVVETWDSEVAASIGFADETWEQLFKDYYTMKNKRDKGLGAKLNG